MIVETNLEIVFRKFWIKNYSFVNSQPRRVFNFMLAKTSKMFSQKRRKFSWKYTRNIFFSKKFGKFLVENWGFVFEIKTPLTTHNPKNDSQELLEGTSPVCSCTKMILQCFRPAMQRYWILSIFIIETSIKTKK